jgi:nucleotide-binding universal stress UspA family protein
MPSMSTLPVVVGVDGSTSATHAAAWAADEAARRGAPLRIVHANLWPTVRMPGGHSPIQYQQPLLEHSRKLVHDAATAAVDRHPGLTVTEDVVIAWPIGLMLAESRTAQLAVLGSRGLGGFTGLLVGSVAVAMAGHGRCPVVVVRGAHPDVPPPADGPVVVGVDGSARDVPVLRFAFEAADRRGVELTALHTWSDVTIDVPTGEPRRQLDWAAAAEDEQRLLAERLAGWRQEFPDVRVRHVVTMDRPVRSLLDAAEKAQLLVVGSRGRGGFTGMLLGSTSQALLHHAPCPLAVVGDDSR